MKHIEIKALAREGFGKKVSGEVRRSGAVPCVIYGNGDNVHFSIEKPDLKAILFTPESFIIEFNINGKVEKVVMREVQYHPVTDEPLHIDFYRIKEGKAIEIDLPVVLSGNSEGVKQGGKLMLAKRKLRVRALEQNLPDEIDVDVTSLGLGKSFFVSDLSIKDVEVLTPATTAICAVKMTRAARGAAATAAAGKK